MYEPVPAVQLDNAAVWEAVLPRLRETVLAGRFILSDEVAEFEEAAARSFGCDWAVGTSSGTSALTLALRAAGLKPRSRVGVPANTFFATFEAIVSAGHVPVVLDVGDDYLIGPQELEGQTLDALVPVHLFGLPVDMPAVMELASQNGWWVLEDCSQAHGATIDGKPVGSFGHAGGFSAYPTKNLGAWGDAGFVTGSDPQLLSEIRALRHHAQHEPNVHDANAGTHRLDSIQALVLLEKLKRLPREVEVRRTISAWYREALADLPHRVRQMTSGADVMRTISSSSGCRTGNESATDSNNVASAPRSTIQLPFTSNLEPMTCATFRRNLGTPNG